MMLTEDYLMRWIRLVTAAIARAAGLRAATLYEDALFLLDQTLKQVVGMPSELINNLDEDSILQIVTTPEGLDTDRLVLVADLIKEQADVYQALQKLPESIWRYQRALDFYLLAIQEGGPHRFPPPYAAIELLLEKLGDNLPLGTQFSLYAYYDHMGQFSEAARSLEKLISSAGLHEDLRLEAQDFYQRMLHLSEETLRQEGLSRQDLKRRISQLSLPLT